MNPLTKEQKAEYDNLVAFYEKQEYTLLNMRYAMAYLLKFSKGIIDGQTLLKWDINAHTQDLTLDDNHPWLKLYGEITSTKVLETWGHELDCDIIITELVE